MNAQATVPGVYHGSKGPIQHCDYLILGCGVAGAITALKLAPHGHVVVATKGPFFQSNSRYAQGGIASVLDHHDTFEAHVDDTLKAGGGLCHPDVVKRVVEGGPQVIQELVALGVAFTKEEPSQKGGGLHLTQEGGHSARRVVHAADLTGKVIQDSLIHALKSHPNITLWENHMCVDLIVTDKVCPDFSRNRCLGAYLLKEEDGQIFALMAKATVLATGGHGKLYLYTSNPDGATGDGVALGWRAGARVANLEFMQFHPTCLYHTQAKNFLISEAVRGEGGVLLNRAGERFMERLHPQKELAPRDVVARAIDGEIKRRGDDFVYLDISHRGPTFVKDHFPHIFEQCFKWGLDITTQPIPVVPAAHYSCGGLVTDGRGRTGVKGLWAVGEVACTGLHGANRLASNSLLECLVFGGWVAQDIAALGPLPSPIVPPSQLEWDMGHAAQPDEMAVMNHMWEEIRRTMWHYVGIVRSDRRLARAESRVRQVMQEIEAWYWDVWPSRPLLETRNLATVALLTVRCARARKESRGIHFNLDYPHTNDLRFRKDTVLT